MRAVWGLVRELQLCSVDVGEQRKGFQWGVTGPGRPGSPAIATRNTEAFREKETEDKRAAVPHQWEEGQLWCPLRVGV